MAEEEFEIAGLFPSPVCKVKRDSNLDSTEIKDIEDIIEEGMNENESNHYSNNSYIFDTRLYNLKEFCEKHIKIYVKKIINPKEELDFYITQSWLNVTKPGGSHHRHSHPNSIISGVFYISTEDNDSITFADPNQKVKDVIRLEPKEYNVWNASRQILDITNNVLILFPSWLEHGVKPNEKAIRDRISISFNIFAKGNFGKKENLDKLIL